MVDRDSVFTTSDISGLSANLHYNQNYYQHDPYQSPFKQLGDRERELQQQRISEEMVELETKRKFNEDIILLLI